MGLTAVLVLVSMLAVFSVGGAAASEDEDLDLNDMIVQIIVDDRWEVDALNNAGVDLVEYLRENDDGTITLNAVVNAAEVAALREQGYTIGNVVQDYDDVLAAHAERDATLAAEATAAALAEGVGGASHPGDGLAGAQLMAPPVILPPNAVTIGRADFFSNYAGTFLSVEARRPGVNVSGTPSLSVSWRTETGSYGSATTMTAFTDPDPNPDAYMYHRALIRIGAAGATTPVPAFVRVASSTGAVVEREVKPFPANVLPNFPAGMLTGFFTSYMDPSQVTARFESLAAEFPNVSELVELPHKTYGLGMPTAIMQGTTGIGTAPSSGTNQNNAVVLYSKLPSPAGETTRAQFANPGAANSPLSVSVVANTLGGGTGKDIIVNLATSSTGALTSTAAQVAAAINAHPDAAALVNATTYPNNAGAGVVPVRALIALSDFMTLPAHYRAGPFTQKMLRIGKHRDGSKVGVYLYCQQHAREWVTPITCVETAERLLRNYGTDPLTTELVDNLEIFILPSYNPDGGGLSLLNTSGGSGAVTSKRTNMANTCAVNSATYVPTSGNILSQRGVDLNRNNQVGWGGDGYNGSSTSCNGETNRGPSPYSEPETKNDVWIRSTFSNIKFSNNIHTYGGYFMWAPGAYLTAGRVTLPSPNIGVEGYFFKAADTILERIRQYRGTVVLPQRTGPIADVLYSAAGNSADDAYYQNGIIAYSFEAGSDRFSSTTSGTAQSEVGFQPTFSTEGRHEAMEFANGNYGMLEAALEYSRDTEVPVATMAPNGVISQTPVDTTFRWVNEPSVIHYTTDGSTPTTASPMWNAEMPRQPGQRFRVTETTTFKWIAVDIKGNTSDVQSALFTIDDVDPTIDLSVPTGGQYLLNSEAEVDFSCADNDAGIVKCEGTQADGDALATSTPGYHTFTVNAEDAAGNTATTSVTYQVVYDWSGFLSTFEDPPTLNAAHSNAVQTFWFRLGGDQGLGLLVSAESRQIDCSTLAPIGPYEPALVPSWDSFAYQAYTNRYTYPWKTTKALKGQCREFTISFNDGTSHSAYLQFVL